VVVLLEDSVDAVRSDADAISGSENVAESFCTSAEALAQLKDAVFEIVWILCVGSSTMRLQLWNLAGVSVVLGELLDSSATDL